MEIKSLSAKNVKFISSEILFSDHLNFIFISSKEKLSNISNFIKFSVGEDVEILKESESLPLVSILQFSNGEKGFRYIVAKSGEKRGSKIESLDGIEKISSENISQFLQKNLKMNYLSEILISQKFLKNYFEQIIQKNSFISKDPFEIILAKKLDIDSNDFGSLPKLEKEILELKTDLENVANFEREKIEAEIEITKNEKLIVELEEKLKKIKYILKGEEESSKLIEEKNLLKNKLETLYEKLGPDNSKIKKELSEKKRKVEEMKYFKDNPPKNVIPKVQDLIRDEETIEIAYENQKKLLQEKEKVLSEKMIFAEKISKILSNENVPKLQSLVLEKDQVEKLENDAKASLEIIENQLKNSKNKNIIFEGIIFGGILFLIGFFINIIFTIFGIITIGVSLFFLTQDKAKKEINSLRSKYESLKIAKNIKLNEISKYLQILELESIEELNKFIESGFGIDIEIKTKSMEVDNMRSDIETKLKPKLDKFLEEKSKILKESGYEKLVEIKEAGENFKNLKNEIDDLEFSLMRSEKDDKLKEVEREIDEIENKIIKIEEELKKIDLKDENSEESKDQIYSEKDIFSLEKEIFDIKNLLFEKKKRIEFLKSKEKNLLIKKIKKKEDIRKDLKKKLKIVSKSLENILKAGNKNISEINREKIISSKMPSDDLGLSVQSMDDVKQMKLSESLDLFLKITKRENPIILFAENQNKNDLLDILKNLYQVSFQTIVVSTLDPKEIDFDELNISDFNILKI